MFLLFIYYFFIYLFFIYYLFIYLFIIYLLFIFLFIFIYYLNDMQNSWTCIYL